MSIRDVANWVLDQSAWWLVPYVIVSCVFGLIGAAMRS